jgi:hypothetical protein
MAEPNQQDVAAPDFEKDDREAFRQTYKPETRTPPISGAGGIGEMDPLARYRQYQQIFKPLTDETQARYQNLIKGQQASATKLAELQGQQQEIMPKGEAEQAQFDLNRQRTAYEDLQKKRAEKPLPPFVPTQDTAQDLVNVFGMIGVFGSLLGTKGTQSGLGAMNAMTGMLTGYKQGRKDLYDRELSTFKEKLEQMKSERADWEKTYSEAQQLAKTDLTAALAKVKETAAEKGAEVILAKARMGQFDDAMKLIGAQTKLENQIYGKFLQAQEANRNYLARKIGDVGTAAYVYKVTGKILTDPKDKGQVDGSLGSLRSVGDLREKLKDPEIQTGLRAIPASTIEKVRSLLQGRSDDLGSVDDAFREAGLTGTDKTVLFLKDAAIMSLQIEQGLTGARVPVFTQRSLGQILDPKAYKPETYDALLAGREQSLRKILSAKGFTENEISKLIDGIKPPQTGTSSPKPSGSAQAAPVVSEEEYNAAPEMSEEEYNQAKPGTLYRKPGDPTVRRKS